MFSSWTVIHTDEFAKGINYGSQALQGAFFSQSGDPDYNPDADLNGDGVIDFADLPTYQEFFFGAPGPSALAP